MDRITVTALSSAEWESYRSLRLEALLLEPQAFGATYAESVLFPDDDWRDRLEAAQRREKTWLLFAKRGDRLVGMIGAFVDRDPTSPHIVAVYVKKEVRGRGVGRLLLEAMLDELRRSAAAKTAVLNVVDSQVEAFALYEKSGFVVKSTELVDEGTQQLHLMIKRLRIAE